MVSCGLEELTRGAFRVRSVPAALSCKNGEEQEEVWDQILLLFALLKSPLETRKVLT